MNVSEDEIVHIDPALGQPKLPAGSRAVWISRSGKKLLVDVLGRSSTTRMRVRTAQGREINVPEKHLTPWEDIATAGPTPSSLGHAQVEVTTASDQERLDPDQVRRITVKVSGRLHYSGEIGPVAGQMLRTLAIHGRRMVVTCYMRDGTKRRYRGNGHRLL